MSILKKLYNKSKEEKGFTLVELIVVLVIIAILAAILVPSLLKYIDTAKQKQATIDARTAYLGIQTAAAEEYAAETIPTITGSHQVIKKTGGTLTEPASAHKTAIDAKKYVAGIEKDFTCSFDVTSAGAITFFEYASGGTTVELKDSTLQIKENP